MTGCPFYGASIVSTGHVIRFGEGGSNRCALVTSSHSPCWMEVGEAQPPEWAICPRNPEYIAMNLHDALNNIRDDSERDDRLFAAVSYLMHLMQLSRRAGNI